MGVGEYKVLLNHDTERYLVQVTTSGVSIWDRVLGAYVVDASLIFEGHSFTVSKALERKFDQTRHRFMCRHSRERTTNA